MGYGKCSPVWSNSLCGATRNSQWDGRATRFVTQVKSSHLYLYSTFNNTNCVKATAQYQNRIISMKAFHYWIQWCHCPAQFSLNSICAIKSVISLEMKCPQLSKPEATRKLWYNLYAVSNLICSECTLYSVPWWPLTLKVEPWAILVICYIWTSSKSRQNECAKCLYIYIEMCSRDCFLFQGARRMLSWHIKVSVNICKCMTKKITK